MSLTRKQFLGRLGLSATLAAAAFTAAAQSFPTKPIKIIVPYPAGGATDVAARMIQPGLQEQLGQPVTVENRPGAGGNIAMNAVAQSPADGHTLVMTLTGMMSINPVIFKSPGFTAADFVPVAQVSTAPLILVVPANSPYKTVPELLAAGKKAGKAGMAYGSAGAGGLSHLASELINGHADGNFTHVPYKGGAPLTQALMAGEVAWGLLGTADARGIVQSGKLRAIGQLRNGRSQLWPELPTLPEQGLTDGVDFDVWFGVAAPAKTPKPVVQLLSQKIAAIVAAPAFGQKLKELGGIAPTSNNTPEAFADIVAKELAVLPKTAKGIGLQLD